MLALVGYPFVCSQLHLHAVMVLLLLVVLHTACCSTVPALVRLSCHIYRILNYHHWVFHAYVLAFF
jgi:hypothetical protein